MCIFGPQVDHGKEVRSIVLIRMRATNVILGFCILHGGQPSFATWLKATSVEDITSQLYEARMLSTKRNEPQPSHPADHGLHGE